jgi:hypothetical protein
MKDWRAARLVSLGAGVLLLACVTPLYDRAEMTWIHSAILGFALERTEQAQSEF